MHYTNSDSRLKFTTARWQQHFQDRLALVSAGWAPLEGQQPTVKEKQRRGSRQASRAAV